MKIIACYKIVYEEQDIVVKNDGGLSFERAELKLSLYDLNAVEEAVTLAASAGGTAVVLSVGDARLENSKLKKSVLSRGPDELFIVKDQTLSDPDSYQTASVLSAAAKKIGFDIIICGEGSADHYSKQTGVQLASILGVPCVDGVCKITLESGKAIVERILEDCVEVLEVTLPAVLCVTSDINVPRVPSMKEILGAGKKPVTEWGFADVGITTCEPTVERVKTAAPKEAERKRIIFEGEDKLVEFCEAIRGELK